MVGSPSFILINDININVNYVVSYKLVGKKLYVYTTNNEEIFSFLSVDEAKNSYEMINNYIKKQKKLKKDLTITKNSIKLQSLKKVH